MVLPFRIHELSLAIKVIEGITEFNERFACKMSGNKMSKHDKRQRR